jgi:beta-galactosidase
MEAYLLEIAKQSNLSIGVNCGSNAWYYDTERNYIFEADQPYQKGSWGYIGGEIFRQVPNRIGIQAQIAQTDQDPLYQTLRTNPEAYQFDVAEGDYEVRLEFADPANAKNTLVNDIGTQLNQSKQQRVFNVSINGQKVIKEMDIENEYGIRTLVQRTFKVRAMGNQGIRIYFTSVKGEPIINAIKIQQLP